MRLNFFQIPYFFLSLGGLSIKSDKSKRLTPFWGQLKRGKQNLGRTPDKKFKASPFNKNQSRYESNTCKLGRTKI